MTGSRRVGWLEGPQGGSIARTISIVPNVSVEALVKACTRILAVGALLLAQALSAEQAPTAMGISISRPFFNPSVSQKVQITFSVPSARKLDVTVVDPDGVLVRALAKAKEVPAGSVTLDWDGKDESGIVVPDESYGLRIELDTAGSAPRALADSQPGTAAAVGLKSFDQQSGVLAYTLTEASRVLVVAKTTDGTSKVIAEWQPRSKGAVIEQWNGFDAAGKTYLPDQPGFAITIQARPLAPGSIIAIGNSKETYSQYAARRKGASSPSAAAHAAGE